jgi:hypothetical protein
MGLILFLISLAILIPFPILYPPIASFAAYFLATDGRFNAIALVSLYSAGIITSLIAATINPYTYPLADPSGYLNSFQNIRFFNLTDLTFDSDDFEPLYKIYELTLSFFIGDDQHWFFLVTALIINFLSIIAVLRICARLGQYRLPFLIFTICYSLVAPALGLPLFLLRSSLSLAILFLGISFYGECPLVFYALGIASVFIHYSSALIFGIIITHTYWVTFVRNILIFAEKLFPISTIGRASAKLFLFIFIAAFFVALLAPNLLTPTVRTLLFDFGSSGSIAAGKAKSFLLENNESFVDFKNPVMFIQISITFLCFLKLKAIPNLILKNDQLSLKNHDLLAVLRSIGRVIITLIILTSPLNFLPLRIGLFNFLYFPLWLINIPFISFSKQFKNYSRYLVLFALVSILVYSCYWIPKRATGQGQYFIEVLEGRLLHNNLIQVIEYYI